MQFVYIVGIRKKSLLPISIFGITNNVAIDPLEFHLLR